MDWTIAIVAAVAVIIFLLIKRMSFVSEETARQHLANGALVIDVRSPEEFRGGNVRGAINIPLGDLVAGVPRRVKEKNQVLLVHCLSGGRSGVAQQQLKGMGYTNVFNLGSFTRAKDIVEKS
ncbi:MAG TPA: rhodanese-like domain-containing protein [Candidatus Paceibacterota bacterium]|nr:rhodanese-like domain-containing protein [Candidatus Paceibacterota bacterium]